MLVSTGLSPKDHGLQATIRRREQSPSSTGNTITPRPIEDSQAYPAHREIAGRCPYHGVATEEERRQEDRQYSGSWFWKELRSLPDELYSFFLLFHPGSKAVSSHAVETLRLPAVHHILQLKDSDETAPEKLDYV